VPGQVNTAVNLPELQVAPAPAPHERFKELLMEKFGSLRCNHDYRLMKFRGHMWLQCDACDARTEGFRVYTPLRGQS
jgi:hypothetical protein